MVTCGRICLQAPRCGSASRPPGRPPREAAELRLRHSGGEKPVLQGRAGGVCVPAAHRGRSPRPCSSSCPPCGAGLTVDASPKL